MTEVFNNIRAECARKRMTIAEMAHCLGIERKTFYNWEAHGDISAAMLEKIADILGVSLEALLKIN